MQASIRLHKAPSGCPAAGRPHHQKAPNSIRTRAAPATATGAGPATATILTAQHNYANLCSNMGELAHGRPVPGYAGRWSRYQGSTLEKQTACGDIIYAFRSAPVSPPCLPPSRRRLAPPGSRLTKCHPSGPACLYTLTLSSTRALPGHCWQHGWGRVHTLKLTVHTIVPHSTCSATGPRTVPLA